MLSLYIQIELFDCSIEQKKQIELLWHYSQSMPNSTLYFCSDKSSNPFTFSADFHEAIKGDQPQPRKDRQTAPGRKCLEAA